MANLMNDYSSKNSRCPGCGKTLPIYMVSMQFQESPVYMIGRCKECLSVYMEAMKKKHGCEPDFMTRERLMITPYKGGW